MHQFRHIRSLQEDLKALGLDGSIVENNTVVNQLTEGFGVHNELAKSLGITEAKEDVEHGLQVGDKVMIAPDALQKHSKSIPAHMGYSKEMGEFRSELSKIQDEKKVGKVTRIFPGSKHINVEFDGKTYGVDSYVLQKSESVSEVEEAIKVPKGASPEFSRNAVIDLAGKLAKEIMAQFSKQGDMGTVYVRLKGKDPYVSSEDEESKDEIIYRTKGDKTVQQMSSQIVDILNKLPILDIEESIMSKSQKLERLVRGGVPLKAKREGKCAISGKDIKVGDEIVWDKTTGAVALKDAADEAKAEMDAEDSDLRMMGYSEAKNPEDHQKKICIDTIKNPAKGLFLGGPSAEQAKKILKDKFGFSDKDIEKIEAQTEAKMSPHDEYARAYKEYKEGYYTSEKAEQNALWGLKKLQTKLGLTADEVNEISDEVDAESYSYSKGKDPDVAFSHVESEENLDEALKVQRMKRMSATQRAAARMSYRKKRAKIKRSLRKLHKKSSWKRRKKKITTMKKGRKAGSRKRFILAGIGAMANIAEALDVSLKTLNEQTMTKEDLVLAFESVQGISNKLNKKIAAFFVEESPEEKKLGYDLSYLGKEWDELDDFTHPGKDVKPDDKELVHVGDDLDAEDDEGDDVEDEYEDENEKDYVGAEESLMMDLRCMSEDIVQVMEALKEGKVSSENAKGILAEMGGFIVDAMNNLTKDVSEAVEDDEDEESNEPQEDDIVISSSGHIRSMSESDESAEAKRLDKQYDELEYEIAKLRRKTWRDSDDTGYGDEEKIAAHRKIKDLRQQQSELMQKKKLLGGTHESPKLRKPKHESKESKPTIADAKKVIADKFGYSSPEKVKIISSFQPMMELDDEDEIEYKIWHVALDAHGDAPVYLDAPNQHDAEEAAEEWWLKNHPKEENIEAVMSEVIAVTKGLKEEFNYVGQDNIEKEPGKPETPESMSGRYVDTKGEPKKEAQKPEKADSMAGQYVDTKGEPKAEKQKPESPDSMAGQYVDTKGEPKKAGKAPEKPESMAGKYVDTKGEPEEESDKPTKPESMNGQYVGDKQADAKEVPVQQKGSGEVPVIESENRYVGKDKPSEVNKAPEKADSMKGKYVDTKGEPEEENEKLDADSMKGKHVGEKQGKTPKEVPVIEAKEYKELKDGSLESKTEPIKISYEEESYGDPMVTFSISVKDENGKWSKFHDALILRGVEADEIDLNKVMKWFEETYYDSDYESQEPANIYASQHAEEWLKKSVKEESDNRYVGKDKPSEVKKAPEKPESMKGKYVDTKGEPEEENEKLDADSMKGKHVGEKQGKTPKEVPVIEAKENLIDKAKEYIQNGGAWAVGIRDVKDFLKQNPEATWKDLKAMMDEAQKEELKDADHMVDEDKRDPLEKLTPKQSRQRASEKPFKVWYMFPGEDGHIHGDYASKEEAEKAVEDLKKEFADRLENEKNQKVKTKIWIGDSSQDVPLGEENNNPKFEPSVESKSFAKEYEMINEAVAHILGR